MNPFVLCTFCARVLACVAAGHGPVNNLVPLLWIAIIGIYCDAWYKAIQMRFHEMSAPLTFPIRNAYTLVYYIARSWIVYVDIVSFYPSVSVIQINRLWLTPGVIASAIVGLSRSDVYIPFRGSRPSLSISRLLAAQT